MKKGYEELTCSYKVIESKKATSILPVECDGLTIITGQVYMIHHCYSDQWSGDGYRTIIGDRVAITDGEAYNRSFETWH
jgi:hypothetical protein